MSTLATLDRWRHRVPFWWWLTYDALVGLVIAVGVKPFSPAFWIGFAVLGIAVAIDSVEFLVKRPSARARLDTLPSVLPASQSGMKQRPTGDLRPVDHELPNSCMSGNPGHSAGDGIG